jgi:hypothetical protein
MTLKEFLMSDAMSPTDETGEAPPVVVEARQWPVFPNKKYSNVQPLWQLILLDLVTFGLYFFYWSYRNWKHLKEYKRLDINTTRKALELLIPIVGIFFAYEQFVAFRDFSTEAGGKKSFDPVWVTIGLIVFNIASRLPVPFWFLSFLVVVPIALVQRTLNSAWAEVEPDLKVRRLPTIEDLLAVIVSWVVIYIISMFFG